VSACLEVCLFVIHYSCDDHLNHSCHSGLLRVYNITEGSPTVVFENGDRHYCPVSGCAFTDGVLVTCSNNILIWDTSDCFVIIINMKIFMTFSFLRDCYSRDSITKGTLRRRISSAS